MYHIANEVAKRIYARRSRPASFIESAFVTKAKSHVGASGLWLFMPTAGISSGKHIFLRRQARRLRRHRCRTQPSA